MKTQRSIAMYICKSWMSSKRVQPFNLNNKSIVFEILRTKKTHGLSEGQAPCSHIAKQMQSCSRPHPNVGKRLSHGMNSWPQFEAALCRRVLLSGYYFALGCEITESVGQEQHQANQSPAVSHCQDPEWLTGLLPERRETLLFRLHALVLIAFLFCVQSQKTVTAYLKVSSYCLLALRSKTHLGRDGGSALFQWWAIICDAAPPLKQPRLSFGVYIFTLT